jgi:hypothetical protein
MKSRRLHWLLLALAATAALAAFGEPSPEVLVTNAQPFTVEPMAVIRPLQPRADTPGPGGDPFAAPATPTPAGAAAIETNAVPPAPTFVASFAWRVIGKQLEDDAGWTVFLARGKETSIVRAGDRLDETYRVAAIQPPTLTLQHIHNKNRRTLDIGEAKE